MRHIVKEFHSIDIPNVGFSGSINYPLGSIKFPVVWGEWWRFLKIDILFIVVDVPTN